MAKKKAVEEVGLPPEGTGNAPEPVVAEAPVAEAPKAEKTSVTVKYLEQGQEKERTYSKEAHGENFAALAQEFCSSPFNKCL